MANIMTIVPEQARGIRKLFFRWVRSQYGGVVLDLPRFSGQISV